MERRFKTRVDGLKKKAGNLATLCDVEICLVVFGSSSQTPTAVWPDGDQIWKAENVGRKYLGLPPKQPSSSPTPSGSYDDQQRLHDGLGGFSEERLRDVARVLEGKLEEAKRKMEALGTRSGQGPARKRAKVGESITSPATPGAVVSIYNNGTINGILDDEANLLILWARGKG